jgi:hypothetical protein
VGSVNPFNNRGARTLQTIRAAMALCRFCAISLIDDKGFVGFGVALCKILRADNKRLIGFGVALCKFYNRLILNDLLALAGA